ncbi:MAG: LptF/LptG family permease [Myxococcota bacterium]|nr:LptF/LptG family permease [Myxococcota bacterium]
MRIARYFVVRVLMHSAMCAVVLTAIYAAIDFVEVGSRMDAPMGRLLGLYPTRLPMALIHILPVALSLGVQLTLSSARRSGEWTALRSAGISPLKIAGALMFVPLCSIGLSGALSMHICPWALSKWQAFETQSMIKLKGQGTWCRKGAFFVKTGEDQDPQLVIKRNRRGLPNTIQWIAPQGSRVGSYVWHHHTGWHGPMPLAGPATRCTTPLPTAGAAVSQPFGPVAASLSESEIAIAIRQFEANGWSAASLRAERALRVALMAACFLVPLLGLGLSFGEVAGGAKLAGRSLAASLSYWLCLAPAWNGAARGAWSWLVVAVWIPLVFFLIGMLAIVAFARR